VSRAFSPSERQPGQPLLVLAALLGAWLVLRVLLWQPPFDHFVPAQPLAENSAALPLAARAHAGATPAPAHPARAASHADLRDSPVPLAALIERRSFEPPPPFVWSVASYQLPPGSKAAAAPSVRRIVGQQLLLAAAFSHLEQAPGIAVYFGTSGKAASPAALAAGDRPLLGQAVAMAAGSRRWSADGWLLLRRDSDSPFLSGRPAYGRSQVGAVLRYRLAAASGHRPQAYARAGRALSRARETEVAAGLSVRPVPGVPLRVAGEVRAFDGAAGRELRPAAFAVTELPPARLPLGLTAEAYAQGGYVAGDNATAFADGQVRVEGIVARLGKAAELRAGAAAWGGAQKGASRVDIGPSAALTFRIGATRSRLAVDYRLRVAGRAEPGSGPALTFSAGF